MIRFEPEGLDCPQCEAQACIRQTLEDGQPCPKCKKGRIRVAGEVEH